MIAAFDSVGLRYGQGAEVLSDISFTLAPGSFSFLTGASGAGKSSLLKLLYRGLRPTRGLVRLFGEDVSRLNRDQSAALKRRIGVVFQDFRLLDHLSAFDNVALPLRIQGEKEGRIRNFTGEILDWVGLADKAAARPSTLSGGEQQRVAIARAVIRRPRLLLADEPTGNVDDRMADRILRLIVELNRLGTTVVVGTHSQDAVDRYPFPRLHLAGGRLLALPPQADLPAAAQTLPTVETG